MTTINFFHALCLSAEKAQFSSLHSNAEPTLNQEEEADDPHHGDDDARHNEGHAPGGWDERPCDERAQDIPHRCVRVPHSHDEPSPTAAANTKTFKTAYLTCIFHTRFI